MSESVASSPPIITCHVCSAEVPDGEFCGACGAHLVHDLPGAAHRRFAYAASPNEHVVHPNIVSTLFPHLPHRRTSPFRVALLVATVLLLGLGYARLTGPSIAVAALALPFLYLLYLYEVEVYEDEPAYVVGLTFVLGVVLSIPWAHFVGPYVSRTFLLNATPVGVPAGRMYATIVLVPLGAQILMLVGALVMYATRRYDEALDGFTFGSAGAMGFVVGATFINLYPQLQAGLVSATPAMDNTLQIVQRGLLIPFIYASTTGLIAGALWVRRGKTRALARHGWTINLWTAIAVAVIVQVGLSAFNLHTHRQAVTIGVYLSVAILLLFWTRIVLHHLLLVEATEIDIGPPAPCSHCHRIVPRMAFCPHCGVATRATPKTGVGRQGRQVR